jgi:hypothetical protein
MAAAGTAATTPAVSKTLTAILVLVAINPTIACRL